jgi:tetratricopeptide (TPR) repeat protein
MGVEPAIPRYQDLLWPTLEVLRGETQPLGFGSILEKLTDTQHSTAEQRAAHQAGERATEFVREDEIGTFRAAYIVLGRRKRLNFAVLASWAGVGVAVLAAGAALLQADVTKDQNREAQRESLITVVGEIAPDVAARQTAKGESEHTLAQALTAYAAQGAELINELPAGSTPPIDGYEVGLAFENVDDYADALKWFDRASAAPGPANYRTSALEDEAAIRFGLGGSPNAMAARAEVQRAILLWTTAVDVPASLLGYETAWVELDDLRAAAPANCLWADRQLVAASRLVSRLERAKVTGYVTELDPLLRAADAAVLNCSHGTAQTFGPGGEPAATT